MTMLKDTIISAFNYDGTLLKWLKKVQEALDNASASEFRVNKKGNATISFSIVFANGDVLESGDIILQQGESVTNATIRQGHLILTLSNGDELDAGDLGGVTGFSINASQHLIVTYQNGTTQDLGAIFSGNVNIDGNFTANSIIENMTGYTANYNIVGGDAQPIYAGVVKNGNKLTFSYAFNYTRVSLPNTNQQLISFTIPKSVYDKLFTANIGTFNALCSLNAIATNDAVNIVAIPILITKLTDNTIMCYAMGQSLAGLTANTKYYIRFEATFLLSDNLAE